MCTSVSLLSQFGAVAIHRAARRVTPSCNPRVFLCIHIAIRSIKAVVTVQRTARGFVARNRVAGRREALATLRSACLGVAMGVIDAYIREV